MHQRRVAEKPDSSGAPIPGRPVVFLWKEGWDEQTPALEKVLEFLNISDQSPYFFPYFSEGISWGVFRSIGKYRELYSCVYVLFPAGDCRQRILDRIAQELPADMPYEVYEVDESDMGRFFWRASSWDLAEEKEGVHFPSDGREAKGESLNEKVNTVGMRSAYHVPSTE